MGKLKVEHFILFREFGYTIRDAQKKYLPETKIFFLFDLVWSFSVFVVTFLFCQNLIIHQIFWHPKSLNYEESEFSEMNGVVFLLFYVILFMIQVKNGVILYRKNLTKRKNFKSVIFSETVFFALEIIALIMNEF